MNRSECAVCLLPFDLGDHLPRALKCLHTFCKSCVDALPGPTTVKCPTCCQECPVKEIKNNFALTDILQSLCEVCSDRERSGPCGHCAKQLCTTCLRAHSQQHDSDVKRLLARLKRLMKDSVMLSVDSTATDVERQKEDETVSGVKKEVDKIRELLDDLEGKLVTKVRRLASENRQHGQRHAEWMGALDEVTSRTKVFVRAAESDGDRAHTSAKIRRSTEGQCKALIAELEQVSGNPPQSTEYHFQAARETTKIKVGDITVRKNTQTRAASVGAVRPSPDYSNMVFKTMTGTKGSGTEEFDRLTRVACHQDKICVTDKNNHRMKIYDDNLRLQTTFGSKGSGLDQVQYPCGITVSRHGQLFVSDELNHRIKVYDLQGQIITMFGGRGSGPGQFDQPVGIAAGPAGDLYVCDSQNYRVQVLGPDGTFVRSIGGKGDGRGEFKGYPLDVAVTSNRVFVNEKGNKHLHVFTLTGDYVESWPKRLPDSLKEALPNGVCADHRDNIIVSYTSDCLVVLGPNGEWLHTVSSQGDGPGQLRRPNGVAVSPRGELVVCDRGNNRVQVFASKV